MCYFTTVAVVFLKSCNRRFVISYPESRLIIEQSPLPLQYWEIVVLGHQYGTAHRWKVSFWLSRSNWQRYKEPVSPLLAVAGNSTAFLARRLISGVYCVLRWYLQCLITSQLLATRQHISNSSVGGCTWSSTTVKTECGLTNLLEWLKYLWNA